MSRDGLSRRLRTTIAGIMLSSLLVGPLLGPALPSIAGEDNPLLPSSQNQSGLSSSEGTDAEVGGLGMIPSSPDKQRLVRMPEGLASVAELPDSVDLTGPSALLQGQPSGQGIPPVGNQGTSNTCTGWATSYYYKTYQEWLDYGWNLRNGVPNYDHIFSPSFVYNQVAADPECDDGAQIPDALNLIVNEGDLSWSQFPFNPLDCDVQPTPAQEDTALPYRGTDYGAFFISVGPPSGPEQNHYLRSLKQRLANNDPLILAFPVYSEFDYYQCNQVVGPPADPSSYRGRHAVAAVGYDDTWAGVGGFKIVNSWGADWGCYGYAWLSYEFVRKYAWEAWWMEDDRRPWIEPHVPDRYSPTIGGTIEVDLTPYENDREDSGTALKWYVDGADKCTVLGQGSANDVLLFQPKPGATGYDEITLILRDSKGAEDRQQLMLGWFDLDIKTYLPLALRY